MGLGLLTVLVVPSGRAEPLRTPPEEEEEDRCDEQEEDEHRHALEGGEGDAPIRIFLRIFHPHRVHHLVDRLDGVDDRGCRSEREEVDLAVLQRFTHNSTAVEASLCNLNS